MVFSVASMCCFFQNENKSILRGENHYQPKHVEAFMYSPDGVLKGKVRASMKDKVYNVTVNWPNLNFTHIIGKANSQINSQKNRSSSIKRSCGMGFPFVNLVCVEPKIGCYGNVTTHFSTLLRQTFYYIWTFAVQTHNDLIIIILKYKNPSFQFLPLSCTHLHIWYFLETCRAAL
jgi:hypothetical protein